MISLSDKVKDEFQQIDLSSLEKVSDEQVDQDKELELDWDKFKIFYEDLKSEQNEDDLYKDLFDLGEKKGNKQELSFEQLGPEKTEKEKTEEYKIEPEESRESHGNESGQERTDRMPDRSSEDVDPKSSKDNTQNEKSASNDINSQPDYDKGFDQGFENGEKQGYEKGFEKGEKQGAEKGEKQGYSQGYAKGEEQAQKDADVKFIKKTEDFKEMLLKLENTYQELAQRYEDKIISLICAISEKVVLARVEIDDEIVKGTVLDALKTLPEPEDIILSISTEDYEYIEMIKEDLFEYIKSLKTVSVKSDTSIKRGGCRIETKQGYVAADIEEKLEKIFSSLKGHKQSI